MDDGLTGLEQSIDRLRLRFPPEKVRARVLWHLVGLPVLGVGVAIALSMASEPKPENFPLQSIGFYLAMIIALLAPKAQATAAVLAAGGFAIYLVYALVWHTDGLWISGHLSSFALLAVVSAIRFRRRSRSPLGDPG
jgi:hypothetical protein